MEFLRSSFRGTLLGALLGDCVGLNFEGSAKVPFSVLNKHLFRFQSLSTVLPYSDDSALTLALSEALIESKFSSQPDCVNIAKSFREHFNRNPDRGYGAGASELLPQLLSNKQEDPFFEASLMFDGTGSYGNGAAMRVSPVALFSQSFEDCRHYAAMQAKLTHAHILGIHGSVLQAVAVKCALNQNGVKDLDKVKFLDLLIDQMKLVETEDSVKTRTDSFVCYYLNILETIKHLVLKFEGHALDATKMATLRTELGNEISAHRSVPLAIFMFLFTLHQPITVENGVTGTKEQLPPLCNSILHCIAMGGDTDTIASMCGAICGAYYGSEPDQIPPAWIKACEANEQFIQIADKIYELRSQVDVKVEPANP
ncbi:ADP-ribosylhydrolase ARH3-like [Symsagittifera roscoffensis]|uniref:ADP-ribosylhydrolase ARH3-like n=1 Tax=Symsagittifera roscoffensis TaxID=84072 RepID=UPI00307C06E1